LKKLWAAALLLLLALGALGAWMFREARAAPLVRRAELAMAGLPPGAAIRIVLISDIHIGTAAMDGARLERIVTQINALAPDLVLIAGDFIFGHAAGSAGRLGAPMVAPLAKLRPRLGTVAVLGNHDHWTGADAVRAQLRRAGIIVLENQAVARGPIAIGGVGDDFSRHDDLAATLRAARALRRPILLFTHSPDIAPALPADAPLLLAGHTHCGQGVLFGIGLAPEVSRHGTRYRCGLVREGGRKVIVTAGLGTSGVPLRIGAPPDLWLLTLRAPRAR
jgi:uncharacterized protein